MKKKYVLTIEITDKGLKKHSKCEGISYPELIGILHYETNELMQTFSELLIIENAKTGVTK